MLSELRITMASRNHRPFQGQFGINETSLTNALDCDDFKTAEEIIESTDANFLNDGPYENIPLRMVLTNNYQTDNSRNLRLAKLLVVKGANTNLRIPYSDLDRACPSPFEELVVYHELLKSYLLGTSDKLCQELDIYFESEQSKLEYITNTICLNNEKCDVTIESCQRIVKDTDELIDIFLEYGSDPNVVTTFSHKTLFHWVVEHEDIELTRKLLATCRVNVNLCDYHGNSPLMDCILRSDPGNSIMLYSEMCETNFEIDINNSNCSGETALFLAVFVSAIETAIQLKKDGACIEIDITLTRLAFCHSGEAPYSSYPWSSIPQLTTPLFAPLLADSPSRAKYARVTTTFVDFENQPRPEKSLVDKVILSSISPLVDRNFFDCSSVEKEISLLIKKTNFKHLQDSEKVCSNDLTKMMFGQTSAGLRQLCVRTIFDTIVNPKTFDISLNSSDDENIEDDEMKMLENDENSYVPVKNKSKSTKDTQTLKSLVKLLCLPPAFQIFFEIESAKYEICELFTNLESMECTQDCSESNESVFDDEESTDDDDIFDSSDSSLDCNDSSLFFSSDLTGDSSDDFDDLSDEDDDEDSDYDELEDLFSGDIDTTPVKKKLKSSSCEENVSSESEIVNGTVSILCEFESENIAECANSEIEGGKNYRRFIGEHTTTTETSLSVTTTENTDISEHNLSDLELSDKVPSSNISSDEIKSGN